MSHESIGTVLAWTELLLGCALLVFGLRANRSPWDARAAPLGLLYMVLGGLRFLGDNLPDAILITLYLLGFAAVGVWMVLAQRAFKARVRELAKEREHTKP
jgi:hypothetical protein